MGEIFLFQISLHKKRRKGSFPSPLPLADPRLRPIKNKIVHIPFGQKPLSAAFPKLTFLRANSRLLLCRALLGMGAKKVSHTQTLLCI